MIRTLLVLAFGLLLFAQSPRDTPDPDPEWEGQMMACDNYHGNAHKCRCALATSCDAHKQKNPDLNGDGDGNMGTRCRTFCKRDHCHCLSPCTS